MDRTGDEHSQSLFFWRGYLKREYIMRVEGMFFVVSLNVHCHDVTKHVLKVAVFTLKLFVGYTHMMSY